MTDNPLLSVFMVAYNHEKYIRQAIESALTQKTDFPFEIVIGEDCSTDNTRAIVSDYEQRYPEKIRVVKSERNVGALANAIRTMKACIGKYVAFLEGDDYWSDPHKLQKQVEILEANPRLAGCFTNAEERFEDDGEKASYLYCNFPNATAIGFKDLSLGNLMPTCSVVYKNNLFDGFPDWYYNLKMGDWPLHLLNAQFGDFWYYPKVTGVHRHHSKGIWMLQDAEKNNTLIEEAYDAMIGGFAGNPEHVACLLAGKMKFLEEIRLAKKAAGMKAKVKDLVIRQIRKL